MKYIIFDIETNGLIEDCDKIYCFSYKYYDKENLLETNSLTSIEEIKNFILKNSNNYFVGHNIIKYDIPVLKKFIPEVKIENIVDTLSLSWYLFPKNKKHGLESWGKRLNIIKKEITDWNNLDISEYIKRCEQDVNINMKLFIFFFNILQNLYGDINKMHEIVNYLNFKMHCLKDQEDNKIYIDVEKCNKYLGELKIKFNNKKETLSNIMPKNLGKVLKKKPKTLFKKDGNLSVSGLNWVVETSKLGLNYNEIDVIREKPNPGSSLQLKKWLMSIGWKPKTFKESKNTGENLPQISLPFGGGLCNSVKELYKKEPNLKELENYYVITHRMGIFKAFLKAVKNNKVYSTAHGFTNTLRLRHSLPIVNLPKPGSYYGEEIRSVIAVESKETHYMCGSDISSLEDSTKQHYIYFYDPKYVEEMRIPGFDPHLDIGVLSNLISEEDSDWFKKQDPNNVEDKERYSKIKKARHQSKTTNFSATYLAGPAKIAETAGISLEEATKLHRIYWKRNWAVKQMSEEAIIKNVEILGKNQSFVFNPISKFWMYLKDKKDVFSTINQSSGVYVFDTWLYEIKKLDPNIKILLQYHDEKVSICKKENKEYHEKILRTAMKNVNNNLKLNVPIDISVEWGYNYAEVH